MIFVQAYIGDGPEGGENAAIHSSTDELNEKSIKCNFSTLSCLSFVCVYIAVVGCFHSLFHSGNLICRLVLCLICLCLAAFSKWKLHFFLSMLSSLCCRLSTLCGFSSLSVNGACLCLHEVMCRTHTGMVCRKYSTSLYISLI